MLANGQLFQKLVVKDDIVMSKANLSLITSDEMIKLQNKSEEAIKKVPNFSRKCLEKFETFSKTIDTV